MRDLIVALIVLLALCAFAQATQHGADYSSPPDTHITHVTDSDRATITMQEGAGP